MLASTVRSLDSGHGRSVMLLALVCCLIFLTGCSTPATVSKNFDEPFQPGTVLVMPFRNMQKIYGDGMSFKCPLCGAVHMVGEIAPEGVEFMTETVYSMLTEKSDFKLVPPGRGEAVRSSIMSTSDRELSELELVLESGRQVGADSVLVGSLFRFRQRVGKAYSVETPASVAFDLLLFRVSDGRKLWSAHFDETQQALNENLFKIATFFKRDAKWLTAEELAMHGLKDILEKFPK